MSNQSDNPAPPTTGFNHQPTDSTHHPLPDGTKGTLTMGTEPKVQVTEAELTLRLATDIARTFYGYFEGGSAGSHDACVYFDNHLASGDIKHLIEERALPYIKSAIPGIVASAVEAARAELLVGCDRLHRTLAETQTELSRVREELRSANDKLDSFRSYHGSIHETHQQLLAARAEHAKVKAELAANMALRVAINETLNRHEIITGDEEDGVEQLAGKVINAEAALTAEHQAHGETKVEAANAMRDFNTALIAEQQAHAATKIKLDELHAQLDQARADVAEGHKQWEVQVGNVTTTLRRAEKAESSLAALEAKMAEDTVQGSVNYWVEKHDNLIAAGLKLEAAVASLEQDRARLVAALTKCFKYLVKHIEHLPLNESAAHGTQALSKEVAHLLDAHHTASSAAQGEKAESSGL